MRKHFVIQRFILLALLLALLSSCLTNTTPRSLRNIGKKVNTSVGGNSGGQNAAATGTNILDRILSGTSVELRWVVNPYTGVYESKVTLPKNFTGTLYLSGNNVSTLSSQLVRVRFKFGRDLEPVIAEATITRAEGITPQTDSQVIALHLKGRPFENIRLNYDLYDYNTYTSTQTPVTDPKNVGLYCRGLKLAYDHTFEGTLGNTACDQAGEKCLYTFARIGDATLYRQDATTGTWTTYAPTQAQIAKTTAGYAADVATASNALAKCLPDRADTTNLSESLFGNQTTLAGSLAYDSAITIGGSSYRYRGPYRLYDQESWEISGDALFSDLSVSGTEPSGLFQKTLLPGNPEGGYQSFLFPRTATRSLKASIEYLGSSNPFDARTIKSLTIAGTSTYMDGCNARLVDTTASGQESLSSCSVTGLIEVYALDPTTGTETVLATARDIKLQLIRASATDSYGSETVLESMNFCSNSNSCGSDQCCFNNKCWSKNYVPTCSEDVSSTGNLQTGAKCTTDYDCASLCCNQASYTCQVHDTNSATQTLCSKGIGQKCVASEWCAKVNVVKCFIVKGSINETTGVQTCMRRCYNVPTYPDCKNGICTSPTTPVVPTFDSSKPDCSNYPNAIDPPSLSDL